VRVEAWVESLGAAGVEAAEACAEVVLVTAERRLSRPLPHDLRRLYTAADGLYDKPGDWWKVWPLSRLVDENLRVWATAALDEALLAFGDDGTGDPFCVTSDDPMTVVRWSWIDHAIESQVGGMADFMREWIDIGAWPIPAADTDR
jgi:cell wall assembly regulator SMI1